MPAAPTPPKMKMAAVRVRGLSEGVDFGFLPAVGITVRAVGMVGIRSVFRGIDLCLAEMILEG